MFGGQTARVFNDGLTPIAWATSTLSTDLLSLIPAFLRIALKNIHAFVAVGLTVSLVMA